MSLALFAVGAGALWYAESAGWGAGAFRVFYLAGAILNVPWLALGTVYLLLSKQLGDRVRAWLTLLSGFAAGVVLFAPLQQEIDASGGDLPAGKEVFGVAPRVLAAVGSGVAALVIAAGAIWSVWRRRSDAHLVVGNILIASGTLMLSASGTLAGRLGKDRAFAITLLIGICLLFAGFLIATGNSKQRSSKQLATDVAR